MRTAPSLPSALLLSVLPDECAPRLEELKSHGMIVRVASGPGRALELLEHRPNLVLVDLVHGPGLDPSVVRALNRTPRAARVIALHEGSLDAYLDQVEDLEVDGFCRIALGSTRVV